jgi:predicted PurR-regulated permease PerM
MKKTDNNKQINISIDSGTIIKIFVLSIAALLTISFLDEVSRPLALIFVAFFLALALNPAVSWIASKLRSRSRVRATGAAYLMVITVLVAFFTLVVPPFVRQTADFIKNVPQTLEDVKDDDSAVGRFVQRYNLDSEVDELSSEIADRVRGSDASAAKPILSTAGAIGSTIASILIVFVLTFMMLVEGPAWLDRFWAFQPKNKRKHRKEMAHKMYKVVTGYVNGQLLIALLGGTFAFIALSITSAIYDAPVNSLALAAIITMFALLPLIGTTLGATIVVFSVLFVSVPMAITMAIFFIIYQQIENVTVQPLIQSKHTKMTPLMVFVAAIIGAGFGGFLGALVAIPVAGILKVVVEDRYQKSLSD